MAFESVGIEDTGQEYPLNIKSSVTTMDENTYTNVLGHIYGNESELKMLGHNAVRFKNGTYSDGAKVDLIVTIRDFEEDYNLRPQYTSHPYNYYITGLSQDNLAGTKPQLPSEVNNGAPLFEWSGFKWIDFDCRFVEAGTNTPFSVTGHFSMSDVDSSETVLIDGVSNVLISEDNDHLTVDGDLIIADARINDEIGIEKCTVTVLMDGIDSFSFRGYQNEYQVCLMCLDSSTLVNFTPDSPVKTVLIGNAATAGNKAIEDGTYVIYSCHAGNMAWDVADESTADGAKIQSYTAHGSTNQQWHITTDEHGISTIIGVASGKALDLPAGDTTIGNQLQLYTPHNEASQQWKIVPWGSGYKILWAGDTSKAIDLTDGSTAAGTPIVICNSDTTEWQQWRFVEVG